MFLFLFLFLALFLTLFLTLLFFLSLLLLPFSFSLFFLFIIFMIFIIFFFQCPLSLNAPLSSQYITIVNEQTAEISALRAALSAASSSSSSSHSSSRSPPLTSAAAAVNIVEDGLSVAEVYDRLLSSEQALEAESAKSAGLELTMEKILREFEAKAPVIKRQQREHAESSANLERMAERVRSAEGEAGERGAESRRLEKEARIATVAKTVAEKENRDLAIQVQTLLSRQSSSSSSSSSSPFAALPPSTTGAGTTGALVLVDSVVSLQTNNQTLLRSNHQLETELQQLRDSDDHAHDHAALSSRLDEALDELDGIREERAKQETMVAAIAQQRDMYRALLAQADGDAAPALTDGSKASSSSSPSRHAEVDSTATIELKNKLEAKQLETDRLTETIVRLKEYEANVSVTLERVREELSSSTIQLAQHKADAAHYKSKTERLTRLVDDGEKEAKRYSTQFSGLQSNLLQLQGQLTDVQADLDGKLKNVSLLEGNLRTARLAKEVSDGAEQRARADLDQCRRDLLQQQGLSESMARIESGLANQASEKVTKVTLENDKLNGLLGEERKRASEDRLLTDRKVNSMADEIKGHQSAQAEHAGQVATLNGNLQTALSEVALLKDKVGTLGRQLMSSSGGTAATAAGVSQLVDLSTLATDASSMEVTKKALKTAQEHVSNYKKIADHADRQLKELTGINSKYKADMEGQVKALKGQLESSKKSLADKVAMADTLGGDLVKQRESAVAAEKRLGAETASVKREYFEYKSVMGRSEDKISEMTREIETHAGVAKSAQENYERELTLHAAARTAVREARDDLEGEKRLRVNFENEVGATKSEMAATKSVWDGERLKLAKAIADAEERLDVNRKQNALLHSQIKTLSGAAEKLGEGGGGGGGGEGDSELRQLVAYMKSENEMVESKIQVLKHELDCERASCSVSKRSLDEARGELKRREEESGSASSASSEEHQKLMDQVNQLNLLRESNAMLREEAEKVKSKLSKVSEQLSATSRAQEPLQLKIKQLEELNVSFSADKESLGKEATNWKNRVKALTSKYDAVDPAEFEEAKEKVVILEKEKEEVAKRTTQREELLKKMRGDYTKAKNLVDALKKERDGLKEEKGKFEGERDEKEKLILQLKQQQLSSNKKGGEGEKEAEELKKTLESKDSELLNANQRLEKFREILRKQKEKIEEKAKQVDELEKKLKEGGGGGGGGAEGGGGEGSMSTPAPPPPAAAVKEKAAPAEKQAPAANAGGNKRKAPEDAGGADKDAGKEKLEAEAQEAAIRANVIKKKKDLEERKKKLEAQQAQKKKLEEKKALNAKKKEMEEAKKKAEAGRKERAEKEAREKAEKEKAEREEEVEEGEEEEEGQVEEGGDDDEKAQAKRESPSKTRKPQAKTAFSLAAGAKPFSFGASTAPAASTPPAASTSPAFGAGKPLTFGSGGTPAFSFAGGKLPVPNSKSPTLGGGAAGGGIGSSLFGAAPSPLGGASSFGSGAAIGAGASAFGTGGNKAAFGGAGPFGGKRAAEGGEGGGGGGAGEGEKEAKRRRGGEEEEGEGEDEE